jgi:hypothetical protein
MNWLNKQRHCSHRMTPMSRWRIHLFRSIPLFPGLLLADAVLLLILAAILPKSKWNGVQLTKAERRPFDRADWLLIIALTVTGATLRIIGSGRSLWIDEISTMAWHIRAPLIDTVLQAVSTRRQVEVFSYRQSISERGEISSYRRASCASNRTG